MDPPFGSGHADRSYRKGIQPSTLWRPHRLQTARRPQDDVRLPTRWWRRRCPSEPSQLNAVQTGELFGEPTKLDDGLGGGRQLDPGRGHSGVLGGSNLLFGSDGCGDRRAGAYRPGDHGRVGSGVDPPPATGSLPAAHTEPACCAHNILGCSGDQPVTAARRPPPPVERQLPPLDSHSHDFDRHVHPFAHHP
jgi:hypothetical protein